MNEWMNSSTFLLRGIDDETWKMSDQKEMEMRREKWGYYDIYSFCRRALNDE